jgi:mRNA interferase YafQ
MELLRHKTFVNDFSKAKLSDSQFNKLVKYFVLLLEDKELPKEAKDHELLGKYNGFREFHLGGDMLVIYYKSEKNIILARIGTHSQLFK